MTLAAVLCCGALFTSCGKSNPDQPAAPDNTPVAAVMDYKFSLSDNCYLCGEIINRDTDG